MLSRQTDDELIYDYLRGNDNSFEHLLKRHRNKIFTYILLTVKKREIAEDIFHDVLLKVIVKLHEGKYHDEGKFLPWVMRISHNMVMDFFRNAGKIQYVDNPENDEEEELDIFKVLVSDEKNAEERIIHEQSEEELRRMINRLPAEQKEVVLMRLYGKMSFREIANISNININTALGRMRYALINLRAMYDEEMRKAA